MRHVTHLLGVMLAVMVMMPFRFGEAGRGQRRRDGDDEASNGNFFIAISFAVVRTNNCRGMTFLLALGAALGNALSLRRSINEERGLSA